MFRSWGAIGSPIFAEIEGGRGQNDTFLGDFTWIFFFFFNKFSSNVCLGGFTGSEPSLSIACCAGPDPTTRSRNSSAMAEFYPNV